MPTSGRYLLDTNILIALLQGESGILTEIRSADEVFLPIIAIGELLFGAEKSGRPAQNRATIERLAASQTLLPCDLSVAREYGVLKKQLREKGRPIPENDMWIAATAIRHSLVLVTRDEHFHEIQQLPIRAW